MFLSETWVNIPLFFKLIPPFMELCYPILNYSFRNSMVDMLEMLMKVNFIQNALYGFLNFI